jgi:hypothetical protein
VPADRTDASANTADSDTLTVGRALYAHYMGALAATVSAVGGGEAGLLGVVGIVAALLSGVLSVWRARRVEERDEDDIAQSRVSVVSARLAREAAEEAERAFAEMRDEDHDLLRADQEPSIDVSSEEPPEDEDGAEVSAQPEDGDDEEDEDEDEEAVGIQRRARAVALPQPLQPSLQPQQPQTLTIENMRAAVREELVVIRHDIKNASRWTFWTGVAQGLLLYVLGIAATLIISG